MLDLFTATDGFSKGLHIKVTAKASANRIKVEELSNGGQLIRVYVTTAAERGKANKEVIKLLAEALSLPPSALRITRGLTSNNKIITIDQTLLNK